MTPTVLSYEQLEKTALEQIKKSNHGVLATTDGKRVTAREMMLLSDGLKISCFTTNWTRKYRQIAGNKNVALAMGNMQIEGLARILGRTSEPQNAWFLEAVKEASGKAYEAYREWLEDPNTDYEIIEITPQRIALFYGPPDPDRHIDVLNVKARIATRFYSSENFAAEY
jgi:general stress protein 26